MQLLLMEDSEELRQRIGRMLRESLPDAQVEEWPPIARGKPAPGFDWKRYDAMLLSDSPRGEDGIAWLRELRAQSRLPTLILAGPGRDDHAVRAIKAGASDYLRVADLSAERLVDAIREALLDPLLRGKAGDPLTRTQPFDPRKIGSPPGDHGVRVPGYKVLRKIGEGGMAKVYLAERESDGQQLVLKMLDAKLLRDGEFLQRFLRECRIISNIRNEHVAMIYDHAVTAEYAYLAMEYFSGGDLKARIRQGISSIAALKILMQMAKALDAVHGAGIVHRDLKPQNIMFREGYWLALVDFGLAKELAVSSTLTVAGMVIATPLYMSPEQCRGDLHDQRSDLYSVGVILYEMLTGTLPFTASNPPALAYQHVNSPIPRLPQRLSGYQPIVDRLMAKRPEERFQSARELFAYIAH